MWFSEAMETISDVRHRNLLALIAEAGTAAKLARATGVPAAYISQVKKRALTPSGKPRAIGDDVARQLEDGMGKPVGWLDQAELSPAERDLIALFRRLSDDGRAYAVARLSRLLETDSDQ